MPPPEKSTNEKSLRKRLGEHSHASFWYVWHVPERGTEFQSSRAWNSTGREWRAWQILAKDRDWFYYREAAADFVEHCHSWNKNAWNAAVGCRELWECQYIPVHCPRIDTRVTESRTVATRHYSSPRFSPVNRPSLSPPVLVIGTIPSHSILPRGLVKHDAWTTQNKRHTGWFA